MSRVELWDNGKHKTILVHRLVASVFLEKNIDTKLTVNHKDGNRLNNRVDNLEWLSREDNIRYGFEHNQYKQQAVILYNENEEYHFRSMSVASSFLKRKNGYISNCIKHNRKISDANGKIYNIETRKA